MRSRIWLTLLSILIFTGFVFFSYLVAKESFTQVDFDTTVRLQDHLSRGWDLPFSVLSLLGSFEVTSVIWIAIAGFCLLKRYWKTLFTLPLFFGALFLEVFGKVFVNHPSPPFLFYRGVINFSFPSAYVHTSYSYPSGHMTRTAFLVTFLILFLHYKWPKVFGLTFQLALILFLISMAISRVYLGEHWLSDVIGGTLLGASVGVIPAILLPARKKAIQT